MASVLHFFFCTKKMFGNRFLVRAHLPSPSFHPFRLLQLSVSDSSSSIEIETLCWKLSRRWRLACFHPSPSSVFIIYQRCQNEEAARVVEELAKSMAICKQVSSLESPMMQPVWKAVGTSCNENKNITDECSTSQNFHLTLDFRAQKPAPLFTSANRMLGYDKNAAAVWTSDEITKNTSLLEVPIPKSFNEVVQVATKPPPLCQSQIYQRGKNFTTKGSEELTM